MTIFFHEFSPDKTYLRTDPGQLHKLDKLDFSMSWHSDKLKLKIAKDLKNEGFSISGIAILIYFN